MSIQGLLPQVPSRLPLSPYELAVARGEIHGWSQVLIYGSNLDTSTSPEVDLWRSPEDYIHWPTTAGPLSLVSTSANDATGGTGATTLLVQGLDNDWAPIQEVVALTGLTPAVTTANFLRVNSMTVIAAGTTQWNEGNITGSIGGSAVTYIVATDSAALHASYSVPANMTLYFIQASVWQGRDNAVTASLRVRPGAGTGPWIRFGSNEVYRNSLSASLIYAPVAEKTDIRITCNQISGGGTTAVFATVSAIQEDLTLTAKP